VPSPRTDVALLALVGVVAHLQLEPVAAAREAARQAEVAPEALLAVRPEEAVQAQHEGPARLAQARERRVCAGGPLGHRRRRVRSDLARLHERPDSEAQPRPRLRPHVRGVQVAHASGDRGRGRDQQQHQRQGQQAGVNGGAP
jgi:hypothetical protein